MTAVECITVPSCVTYMSSALCNPPNTPLSKRCSRGLLLNSLHSESCSKVSARRAQRGHWLMLTANLQRHQLALMSEQPRLQGGELIAIETQLIQLTQANEHVETQAIQVVVMQRAETMTAARSGRAG